MQTALKESRVSRIDFITVTTSASCLVCVDGNGKSLCRALMVSDKRAKREVNEINAMPEFQSVRDKTGLDLNDVNKFNVDNGVLEDGKASSRIADVIDNFISES